MATSGELVPAARPDARAILGMWLTGRSPETVRGYQQEVRAFGAWVGREPLEAVGALLELQAGPANALVLQWRNAMRDGGLAPATVNRRLAALASLVKLARMTGAVTWALEVEPLRVERLRDTRGPGVAGVQAMLGAAARRPRDGAILHLLFDLALRRGEVVGLDMAHVEVAARRVWVLGKGRLQLVAVSLPDSTWAAVARWLGARGLAAGPLFPGEGPSGRLSGESVRLLVARAAREAGIEGPVRPHGLRHAAITAALDAGRGVREVQKFSRHAKVEHVERYDDNRLDIAGDVAAAVAGLVG